MMMIHVFPVLLLVGSAIPFSFRTSKLDYNFGGAKLIPWDSRTVISREEFPCEMAGPVQHSVKCNQFYMCKKVSQRSDMFNRFLYECEEGQVYSQIDKVCIPGRCLTDVIADSGGPTGGNGDPGTSTSVGSLPPLNDQGDSVVSPPDESEKEPKDCSAYLYVQSKQFCNLFHRCNDPKPVSLYSCATGTAFNEEAQMCRIESFDGNLCLGKTIYTLSEELLREAFAWTNVGVLPLADSTVSNANSFIFTDLDKWQASADPEAARPLPFKTFLRFAEFAQEEQKPQQEIINSVGLRAGVTESTTTTETTKETTPQSQLENTPPVKSGNELATSLTKNKPPQSEANFPESLKPTLSFNLKKYDLFSAIQYPFQATQSQNLKQPISDVHQATGSQYIIPVVLSSYQSPSSPFSTFTSPFTSQAASLPQIFRQPSFSNPQVPSYAGASNPATHMYANTDIGSMYPFTRFQQQSYSPYASSPFPSLYQFPNIFSPFAQSPSNYFPRQTPYSASSLPYTLDDKSASPNPYEMFQFNPDQYSDTPNPGESSEQEDPSAVPLSFKKQTFLDDSDPNSPMYTFLYDPLMTNNDDAFQSRNEDGEGYHVIPLTDSDIITLVEHSVRNQSS